MRFAISLLTVICIASVIGTVVKQNEPANNVVNQFGPFWADLFTTVGLTRIYSAWWFLVILAFLVLSTSLCIARNAPRILADLRNYKEHVREQSLLAFHLHAQGELAEAPDAAYARTAALLTGAGWRAKVQQRREGVALRGTMIAARRGATNRLGYIAAHSAIVLVCIGGLFDGDLVLRAQMWLQGKTAFDGAGLIRDVPAQHRLGPGTPAFRANLFVPEGERAGTAVINQPSGVVLQDLPFDVELKKFIVEYYDTGMPRLFASEIVIHDRDTGQATPATVKVNEPAQHRGIAIYQSSFDDGGSSLKLRALPLTGAGKPFDIDGSVGTSTTLAPASGGEAGRLKLEFTGLRVINVENMGGDGASATDVRAVDLARSLDQHLGSGAKPGASKGDLRNVGPSFSYKLRDASGQAREFNNYMLPVEMDGRRVFLAGVRDSPAEPMRYLRIPADGADSIDEWLRLRGALLDAGLRNKAAQRYGELAAPADKPEMRSQLAATALRALSLFAGAGGDKVKGSGLQAISDFLETSVPEDERGRISEVLLRILNGSLFELMNLARADAGLAPLAADDKSQSFIGAAMLSLSDSFFYPAPVLLMLTDFKQVQASVFQVTRAPGQTLVYIGCVLLIVGVFAMLYIRERRLWVWLAPQGDGRTRVTMALASTRHTLAADAEFDTLKKALLKDAA
ncbi:MAG: cytochrome c biogenesis protein ResB [Ideonella sp.]|nr:cytochrome c biogenesis protein ResB [Ideonella sp.]